MDVVSYAKASSAYKLARLVNNKLVNKVDVKGSSILVPIGTTATRPALGADEAALRHNSDTERIEEWTGTEWKNLSVSISAATLKGKDTEANILAKVNMVAEDLWIAIDTLDGWIYDGSAWINVGPLQGPKGDIGNKGDKGDTGNDGISVLNTVFTSTTDPCGLPCQSGATDTYTINYDNLETDTFTIKNGVDGLNTVIDTLEFEALADDVNYTVSIDTTDGIFEVYFNGMLLPSFDYSLTGSTIVINKPVVIGDDIIVKKIVSVDVLNTYSQAAINSKVTEAVLQSKNYTDNSMATGNAATATKLKTPININEVSFDGSTDITVSDDTAVKLTGDQTIDDVKTFTSSPIVPTPTTVNQAVNKQYVDNMVISQNGSNSYAVAMAIVFGS